MHNDTLATTNGTWCIKALHCKLYLNPVFSHSFQRTTKTAVTKKSAKTEKSKKSG